MRIISLAFSDLSFSGWVELINFIYYELMKKMLACVMTTVFFVNTIVLVMLTGMGGRRLHPKTVMLRQNIRSFSNLVSGESISYLF